MTAAAAFFGQRLAFAHKLIGFIRRSRGSEAL
jgi:hypothetical protein